MTPAPFCTACGKRRIRGPQIGYSAQTGDPQYRRICPSPTCPQGCLDTGGHVYRNAHLFTTTFVCARCQHTSYAD